MKKLILFDIDGTLLGYTKKLRDRFSFASKEIFGIDVSIDEIDHPGKVDMQIIFELLKLHGIEEADIKKNLNKLFKLMAEFTKENIRYSKPKVLPGARRLLETLKRRKYTLGLVTGNIKEVAKAKLEINNLWKYFQIGGFGDMSINRTDLVKMAIKQSKMNRQNVVLIGDSPRDIKCGKEAGVKTIIVATGYHAVNHLKLHRPDFVFKNLTNTQRIIDAIEST